MYVGQRAASWSLEDFLDWEAGQEPRFEFDGFEPVGMVGAVAAHHRIIRNAEAAIQRRLTRCEVFRETMKLRLAQTVRYPDLMIVCSQVAAGAAFVTDPVVVIEVLSDGTAQDDRISKNEEYRQTPSIQHYIMLEQDRAAATVFVRVGGDWVGRVVTEGAISLPAVEVELPLAEIYQNVWDPA